VAAIPSLTAMGDSLVTIFGRVSSELQGAVATP
jgi:hypothetical protein